MPMPFTEAAPIIIAVLPANFPPFCAAPLLVGLVALMGDANPTAVSFQANRRISCAIMLLLRLGFFGLAERRLTP